MWYIVYSFFLMYQILYDRVKTLLILDTKCDFVWFKKKQKTFWIDLEEIPWTFMYASLYFWI